MHHAATPLPAYHTSLGLSYLHAGEYGPPVVMLHGWGAFKELWWSTLRRLGRDHRCFALDLPGHGGSPLGQAATLAALAQRVAAFCDDMGLQAITLLGHSMGGAVAVELALARPDLVAQLVLVDAAVDAHLMPFFARIYMLPGWGWVLLRCTQALGRALRPLTTRVPHEHGGGWLRPWMRRNAYLATFEPEGLHRIYRSLFATRAGPRLAQLRMPTLVISGQLDSLVPAAHSRRLAQRIAGARYVEIFGALHNPMDERPAAFEKVIRSLWAEDATRRA
ncbi:MAG: alpha/beta hydrolase [Candidatus Viridilinea halotolerans]|uniref:Alpha/beta hydrolase n=1 Tax=Candidatus Viridilinea halotolerans TaxID=2491704 RepID=A0A426TQB7_9CHLR|nr:MAG: alpha/beta hydrolase [Candidatus Viridilinea halotolerans]